MVLGRILFQGGIERLQQCLLSFGHIDWRFHKVRLEVEKLAWAMQELERVGNSNRVTEEAKAAGELSISR